MAKVYQALQDVSIPKPVTKLDPEKEDSDWVTEGATYPRGALISEEWLTPRDRKRAENGELAHVLQESDQELPEGYVTGGFFNEPEQGVFIPEHEAEATALRIAGHVVVPNDQKMEFLSSSAQHQADYQNAVREHGADKRPVLEMLQQEPQRVPDEVLYGGETPTGLPHWRGEEGGQEEALSSAQEKQDQPQSVGGSSTENPEAVRPAPGSAGNQDAVTENRSEEQKAEPQTVQQGQQSSQPSQPAQS